jgi:hypothetical protein
MMSNMARLNHTSRTSTANRRAFGRRNCLKSGRIVLTSGCEIPCLIVNISEGGALLQLKGGACDHDAFSLILEEDNIIVLCEVAHRTNGRIGVRYVRMPRRLGFRKNESAESPGKVIAGLIARGS